MTVMGAPSPTREDLLDILCELQHDLGKYLVMPLAFLPAAADAAAVRSALRQALTQTRRRPGGVRSARQMWTTFETEVGSSLSERPGMRRLKECVERALGWEEHLDDAAIDRSAAHADLAGVGDAIRGLIDEIGDEIGEEIDDES